MGQNQKTSYAAAGSLNALTFDPDELHLVIDKAHPLYDERVHDAIDDAMVRNIMAVGIIQPIVIARDWDTGQNLVVAGRQRVKNAREANRRLRERGEATILVPAVIRKLNGAENGAELAAVAVSENEIRRPDGAMVKARKMQHLEKMGHDVQSIALHFGVNELTVKNHLALIGCSKPVQKAVEGQYIGITDVQYLSRLTPAQQTAKVEEIVKATVGKEGHARAKAKRAVLATAAAPGDKPAAPKMMGRKDISAKLKEISECGPLDATERKGWREALEWVLGATGEPEKGTKTRDLVDELATEGAK